MRLLLCAGLVWLFTTACAEKREYDMSPLLGLPWFAQMEQAEAALAELELMSRREADSMTMLDYNGAELFGIPMSVTLCFRPEGLIGVNYHDTKQNQSYITWMRQLEDRYGIPNENAIDCASWFEDPLGKDTAVYIFALDECVQISFYNTWDTPDKAYRRERGGGV